MIIMHRIVLTLAALLVATPPATAKPPELKHLLPTGAQRGQTVEVTAVGTFDPWPTKVWVQGRGVTVETGEEAGSLRVTVSADAPLGLAWIWLYNEEGASALRPFAIGSIPEVLEVEPNDDPAKPQMIEPSTVTINGRLEKSGDVDGYGVQLEAGQTLVASMVANNVFGSPMDGTLQVATGDGFVLAHVDDDQGFDPRLAFTAPESGTYIVRAFAFPATPNSSIRFAGGDDYVYRLTLTTGPFADHAHPMAVSIDEPGHIEVRGWNLPAEGLSLPLASCQVADGVLNVEHASLANLIPVPLVPHPAIVEPATESEDHEPLQGPFSVSGHIDPPGDRDVVGFQARKGETWLLRVAARAIGSPLDPVLRVLDANGKVLKREDDPDRARRDPETTFEVPEDGVYEIEITDLNDRGSPRHAYRVDLIVPEPNYRLTVKSDRFTMEPGKTLEVPITIDRRHGFDRPIEILLEREGVPVGLQAPSVSSCPEDDSSKEVILRLDGPEVGPWSGTFRIVGRSLEDRSPTHSAEFTLDGLETTSGLGWLTVLGPKAEEPAATATDAE